MRRRKALAAARYQHFVERVHSRFSVHLTHAQCSRVIAVIKSGRAPLVEWGRTDGVEVYRFRLHGDPVLVLYDMQTQRLVTAYPPIEQQSRW